MIVQEVIDTLQEMVKKDSSVATKAVVTDIPFDPFGHCDLCVLESIDDSTEGWGIAFNFGKDYLDEED
jgi:hypothetical protein